MSSEPKDNIASLISWWHKAGVPWRGSFIDRFILKPESDREARVQKLRLEVHEVSKRKICMEVAKLKTASYQVTEGEHPASRRAKAINNVFENIPIPVSRYQLLMGTAASEFNSVEVHPEFLIYGEDARLESNNQGQPISMHYVLPPEEQQVFEMEIAPFWKKRSRSAYLANELQVNYPEVWFYLSNSHCYIPILGGPLYHTIQDYRSILEQGLNGIKEQIHGQMAGIDPSCPKSLEDFERMNHYRAMITVADGIINYANRCAEAAEQLAESEQNRERQLELVEIARICRKVPAQSAESWWEALQSWHFLHIGTGLAEGGNSHSAGRFDQYMYPFLQRDLEHRAISLEQAQELLECFFLKWNEAQTAPSDEATQGVGNNDKLTVGGMDVRGHDSTNILSYMCLEAQAHVHLLDPNLSVRFHKNTPEDFMNSVLQVVRLGSGQPILINDEAIIPSLLANGVSLVDARNYADTGCQENLTDPNVSDASDTHGHTNAGFFNLVKPIELAIFRGINPANGVQVGPDTGDPGTFKAMDDFTDAVRRQFEYAVRTNVILNNVIEYTFARYYPCVFHNLMHPGPRASGKSINAGACKYNWTGSLAVGTANAGDIMSAIDRLIYEEHEVTWRELLDALQKNWGGYESLRQQCIAAPKYGTNDDYADKHVRNLLSTYFEAYQKHTTPRGGRFVCGLITMSAYEVLGRTTGATPDGRQKGEPLADSTAPSRYASTSGLLAAHRSAARAIDAQRTPNGITFNQRMNYTLVSTDRDVQKWADMLRTYMEAGGMQVQYSIADKRALLDAQKNPEKYRDLIVRVGGHSAFFIDLSKEIQDSIIARVEG